MNKVLEEIKITLTVNGKTKQVIVKPNESLLDVLRREFKIFTIKGACEQGICGLCTVLVDGKPIKSCMALAYEFDGSNITTIEGLRNTKELKVIQQKFIEHKAFQCGFCTPAFELMAYHLITKYKRALNYEEVAKHINGVLCRCTGYKPIIEAIIDASKTISIEQKS